MKPLALGFVCRVFGHWWGPWHKLRAEGGGLTEVQARCRVCRVESDWRMLPVANPPGKFPR